MIRIAMVFAIPPHRLFTKYSPALQLFFDGVVKTSIYCVVCPVAILDILHV